MLPSLTHEGSVSINLLLGRDLTILPSESKIATL